MNKLRRKELKDIISKLEELDSLRQEITEQLESVKYDEEEALNNLPESLQEGARGQHMQECIDTMENVIDDLESADLDDLADQILNIVEG